MNKRTRVLKHALDVSWIVGVLAALLETFVFRDSGPIFYIVFILLYLTIVGLRFYSGIESIQKAKTEGIDVPWWKESDIVFAFGMALLGGGVLLLSVHAFDDSPFLAWIPFAGIVVMIYACFMQIWRFIRAWRRKRVTSSDQEKKDM
jgi:ABC-type uncharacterized transport system permease subunit